MRRPSIHVLLLAALAISGCELRLATDVAVDADGSGTVEVAVGVDRELDELLRDADVDILRGIEDVRRSEEGWEIEPADLPEGGREVRLRARFDDPDGLDDLLRSFHEGLDEEDPRLWESLRLRRLEDRSFELTGRVGFLPPSAPGARGQGVAFDEDAFRDLLEERGDEFIRYDVRVTFPADLAEHDADEVLGRSAYWSAPVGELRDIAARSQPVSRSWPVLAVIAAAAFVLVLGLGLLWRRRRG